MQFLGLTFEDYDSDDVELWPDNLAAVNLFIGVGTQWRVGFGGPYGLDYGVLFHKMDRMGLAPDAYARLEEEIRTLESAALDEMHADKD
jgi:hypothetical protein